MLTSGGKHDDSSCIDGLINLDIPWIDFLQLLPSRDATVRAMGEEMQISLTDE